MPFARQQTGAVTLAATINKRRAVELRIGGANLLEIARAVGVSKTSAHRYLKEALAELKALTAEAAEEVRDLDLERMDGIWRELWPKRADPRVADTLIRLLERRAKLLGLDAPEQIRLGGVHGAPVGVAADNWDLNKLSIEQLRELDAITAAAHVATPPTGAP